MTVLSDTVHEITVDNEKLEVTFDRRISESRRKKSISYIFLPRENVLENLMNRRNRPTTLYKKILLQLVEKTNIKIDKPKWEQKAGCGCGCSPGFLFNVDNGKTYSEEWYVTIKTSNPDKFKVKQ